MSFDIFLAAFERGKGVDGNAAAARKVLTRHASRTHLSAFVTEFTGG
jgi:hypothetical protein